MLYIVRLFFKKEERLYLYTITLCHFQIYICISFINKVLKKHVSLLCCRASTAFILERPEVVIKVFLLHVSSGFCG